MLSKLLSWIRKKVTDFMNILHPTTPLEPKTKIVCIGDSNTAYMQQYIPECVDNYNWTVLLAQQSGIEVINAGIGIGNTSMQMLARFQSDVLNHKPNYCIIEQGANDTLNSIDPSSTISNISQMVQLCLQNNIVPLVMNCTPQFESVFWYSSRGRYPTMEWEADGRLPIVRQLEKQYCSQNNVAYIDVYTPFLLTSTAQDLTLYATDKVHSNSKGHKKMVECVLSVLQPMMGGH